MSNDRSKVRALAHAALAEGKATGWFERVYTEARAGTMGVPWDDRAPNAMMVRWLDAHAAGFAGGRALDVGCGLGDNAEELARRGLNVTAFDVAPTAVAGARERFPHSPVAYEVVDLFTPPSHYLGAFDLVAETYTVQALPPGLRPTALGALRALVAPGGTLLVIAAARDAGQSVDGPPWPLSREDLAPLDAAPFTRVSLDDLHDAEGTRRWVAAYRRAG